MEELADEFEAWVGEQGLPHNHDAHELLLVASVGGFVLRDEQRLWLNDFIVRWDRQQEIVDRLRKVIALGMGAAL